jgi:hypothetical protein
MSQGRKFEGIACLAAVMAIVAMLSVSTTAKAEEAAMDQVGEAIGVELGIDYATDYYFRGIGQENQGFIFQPYGTFALEEVFAFDIEEGKSIGFSPYVSFWASMHEANQPSVGNNVVYEIDYIIGVEISLPMNFSADLSYIFYTNPSGGGQFAQEVDLSLTYDATELLAGIERIKDGEWTMTVLFAFETAGLGADGVAGTGIYFEFNTELVLPIIMAQEADLPIDGIVGLTVGLSLDDYYVAGGEDDTFGFVDVYIGASMPLDEFFGVRYGQWTVTATVHFLFLGDNAQAISAPAITDGDEDFKALAIIGVATEF